MGLLLFAGALALGQRRRAAPPPPPEPDEIEEAAEPEYVFNPIQAEKEMKVGDFYFKKKSYRAAAGRYERAAKWNPQMVEAYYKLGRSREKLDQIEGALAAYQKYLELSPSGGKASEVKKKITELEGKSAKTDERSRDQSPASGPRSF